MKKIVWIALFAICSASANAQWNEAMQLALNIQKLNQLRQILQNMYDGYKILTQGYNKVKNITEGNYKLHEAFLDGLMAVNPAVKNYKRVADIISHERKIIKEYKAAFQYFVGSGKFSAEEISYLEKVYSNLIDKSVSNVDALLMVITASKLRMSDAERIAAIDRIFSSIDEQLIFLR